MTHSSRSASIVGATGLVGGHLVQELAKDSFYGSVVSWARRRVDHFPGSVNQQIIDFDRLEEAKLSVGIDVFCALGTTIKVAGSQDAFRKVDLEYPLRLAEWSLKQGAERFFLVSSAGADERSRVFYSRTKGELEESLKKLPFQALHIFRPSLLLGERKEHRAGEQFAKIAMGVGSLFLQGPLRKYRAIEAKTVAYAMLSVARETETRGIHTYESDTIQRLGFERGSTSV